MSVFASHNLAVKTNGTLWAWGRNVEVQLGDGTNEDKSSPTLIACPKSSTDNLHLANFVKLYPNPTHDLITIEATGINAKDLSYEIKDAVGNVVVPFLESPDLHQVDVRSLAQGTYFLTIWKGDEFRTMLFVKLN